MVVILDGHGLNRYKSTTTTTEKQQQHMISQIGTLAEEAGALVKGCLKTKGSRPIVDDYDDESGEDEERRRYVKRQRQRGIIDDDGVHEIRFDDSSSASTSAMSSPRSGIAADDDGEIVMIDAGMRDDDKRRLIEVDMEREGDAARVLEEMKLFAAGMRNAGGMKKFPVNRWVHHYFALFFRLSGS